MGRYRFAVEYLGTDYVGWQVQPEQISVQSELEKALEICLRTTVKIVGAGRTDAGVHATGQVAHFDCEQELNCLKVERSLNALTPDSLAIRRLEPCSLDFHARYSAQSRLYRYRIALRPTALLGHMSWFPGIPMDADRFGSELAYAMGKHDFVNFSVPREDGKSTECEVLQAQVHIDEGFLIVTLEANRFLHKMVRSLVGASFDVARQALPRGLVRDILGGNFKGERTWAPAKGLSLERVRYQDYEY
jgi:tRNA pseudouridine38-40 synthase